VGADRIQRALAVLGLLVLVPVAWGLFNGRLSLADAGLRAGAILVVVVALGRLGPWLVLRFADTLDGTWKGDEAER